MELGGAPHWAKQWSFLEDEGIYPYLRAYVLYNLDCILLWVPSEFFDKQLWARYVVFKLANVVLLRPCCLAFLEHLLECVIIHYIYIKLLGLSILILDMLAMQQGHQIYTNLMPILMLGIQYSYTWYAHIGIFRTLYNCIYNVYRHYGENMTKFTEVLEAINGEEKDIFINKSMKKLLFE